MVKRLRTKFIVLATTSVLSVIVILLFSINMSVVSVLFGDADKIIQELHGLALETDNIYEWYGKRPYEGEFVHSGDSENTVTFFVIHKPNDGTPNKSDLESIPGISPQYAEKLTFNALNSYGNSGNVDNFRYKVFQDDENTKTIIFLNVTSSISFFHNLLNTSVIVSVVSLIVAAAAIIIISNTVVSSTAKAVDRQKQFITNASHDLKTPIAVINANMDVLSLKDRDNQWIQSTKQQASRLKKLVENLIAISKLNEDSYKLNFESFDLSTAVSETAEQFGDIAELQGLSYEQNIQPNIIFYGNETYIRQLVTILCENAVKYSDEKGSISLSLTKYKSIINLTVENTFTGADELELSRLFDRFYRGDKSRSSKNGGNGIGLAMASAITDAHDGEISAHCPSPNTVRFTTIFKSKV